VSLVETVVRGRESTVKTFSILPFTVRGKKERGESVSRIELKETEPSAFSCKRMMSMERKGKEKMGSNTSSLKRKTT